MNWYEFFSEMVASLLVVGLPLAIGREEIIGILGGKDAVLSIGFEAKRANLVDGWPPILAVVAITE